MDQQHPLPPFYLLFLFSSMDFLTSFPSKIKLFPGIFFLLCFRANLSIYPYDSFTFAPVLALPKNNLTFSFSSTLFIAFWASSESYPHRSDLLAKNKRGTSSGRTCLMEVSQGMRLRADLSSFVENRRMMPSDSL